MEPREFLEVGQDMMASGAITSHGGNLSVTDGRSIWITRTGARLGHLTLEDILTTAFDPSDQDQGCSMELLVHRAMYQALPANELAAHEWAVAHSHSLYATAASLASDSIQPVDAEARYLFPELIPVLDAEETIASPDIAFGMAQVVAAGGRIAVIRGHGVFALGESLVEAYRLISSLEHSCQIAFLLSQIKED